jgi:ComF family protein
MILNFANATLRLLLNPLCAACDAPLDRPLEGPVCGSCWRAIARLTAPCCLRCGDALVGWHARTDLCVRCLRNPPVFAAARSAGRYDGALRRIIHAFKYERRRVLAGQLAEMMKDAGADMIEQADAVVPVPLHPWRMLSRGFNQAEDLARRLGRPVCRVLRRRRHGPPQAGLPAGRRHANVRRAYALRRTPGVRAIVRGKTLVLVDDVMTTGATLEACAGVLLEAGAQTVLAITAARAVAGRPVQPRPTPDLSDALRR